MRKKPKIKTEWNLNLLYKNEKDPQIEKDIRAIEKANKDFAKKYKNKDFISSPLKLASALRDQDKLIKKNLSSKPWWYFALRTDLDSNDAVAGARSTQFSQRLTKAHNEITFFKLKIASVPHSEQKKFLSHHLLFPYKYYLKKVFEHAKYRLSEKEEQLEDLLSATSYAMWVDGQEKILTQKTIKFRGKELPIGKAFKTIETLPTKPRRELHKEVNKLLKSISPFAESEINAIVNYKKVMDEMRGFKQPYSAMVLGSEMKEKNVEDLIKIVEKHFSISHRFYKLQARLLKEKRITLADRGIPLGKINKKFDFNGTVKIVRDSFNTLDPIYGKFVDEYARNGQLDVYPRKGKKPGAYSWGPKGLPTYVLLNHEGTIDSVETLAHEMGHSIHTELSKKQPIRYQKYSLAVAEVASTFFEQLTGDYVTKFLSEKEKAILLHNKLLGDISTIFRQVAFFNFELELHNTIRKEGLIPASQIAKIMVKHMKSYLGPSVDVTEDDGYFFVYISHIRRFFYVFSYAYGQLTSRALYEKLRQDKSFAPKIEKFLTAGRSKSPIDIFKDIGIDTSKKAFFEAGLRGIEKDIERLEKLTRVR
ncbi:MAG: M3 family oligoendopeptidase [Parcubacteria group bacterium]